MKSLKIATVIMVLVVLAGYYYFNYYTNQNNALDDFAYGNGRIEATEVNVATKISGRVEKVLVKEGDIVEKGQAIALLDTKELKAKLAMANAQINQAKENKNYALSLVIQKQSELSLATKEYERAKKLYASKSIWRHFKKTKQHIIRQKQFWLQLKPMYRHWKPLFKLLLHKHKPLK